MKISYYKDNINILIIANVSKVSEFCHNLLNIIFLARKDVEVFLREANQLSIFNVDEKVFHIAYIIENQLVFWLAETAKPVPVNQVIVLTIKS